jgi:hypothetical protein
MFALVKNETITHPLTQETSEIEIIKLFAPYTIWEDKNGTQYSPDYLISLTSEQKQDLGIYDVAYGTRGDDRFYSVVENDPTFDQSQKIVKVTYTSTAKELEDGEENNGITPTGLKSQWISQIKQTANSLLSQTDWMLVRKIERDVAIPAATVAYRAAIITEANRLETAINAATNITAFITAVTSLTWPTAE